MAASYLYISFLFIAIGCMALCDYRWKLVFFHDAARAAKVTSLGVLLFIIWDISGVVLGIFFAGNSPYTLGVEFLPRFHLEELFFLFLLTYTALNIWRSSEKLWQPISS